MLEASEYQINIEIHAARNQNTPSKRISLPFELRDRVSLCCTVPLRKKFKRINRAQFTQVGLAKQNKLVIVGIFLKIENTMP